MRALGVVLAALLGLGCAQEKEPSFGLKIGLAPSISSSDSLCPPEEKHMSLTKNTADVLRLTVMRETDDESVFVCDRLITLGESNTSLYAPVPEGQTVTVVAEAWKLGSPPADGGTPSPGEARLVASGRIRDIDLHKGGAERILILEDARSFNCTVGISTWPRAFHTATLLPDGRVVIVGGLTPSLSGDPRVNPAQLYATSRVEVYDPATQTFTEAVDNSSDRSVPRAFHSAYLLPDSADGKASILLVGGMTPKDGNEATAVATVDGLNLLDIAPTAQATAARAEILVLDLATLSFARGAPTTSPEPRFMAATTAGSPSSADYVLVTGGAISGNGTQALPVPHYGIDLLDSSGSGLGLATAPQLTAPHVGGSAVYLGVIGGKRTWLVVGGNLWANDIEPGNTRLETAVEIVEAEPETGVPQTVTSGLLSPPLPLEATAFGTATPIPYSDGGDVEAILVAGGFVIRPSGLGEQMAAIDPLEPDATTSPLQVIRTGPVAEPVPLPAGLRAVGMQDAVLLPDRSVLVTGGSAYFDGTTNNCPTNEECPTRTCPQGQQQQSRQCAVCQAFRYTDAADAANRRVEIEGNLKVPRFGHRSTLLQDGTVLITGGITSRLEMGCTGTDMLMMLTSAEIYNPQGSGDDPLAGVDPAVTRSPGAAQSANSCCTCPSSIEEANALYRECSDRSKRTICPW